MADSISSTQSTQSTGANTGYFRDVNASASLGEFLNNLNASTSSAIGGTVTIGDRILGGSKSERQFGILQTLAIVAGGVIIFKLWKDGSK